MKASLKKYFVKEVLPGYNFDPTNASDKMDSSGRPNGILSALRHCGKM